MSLNKIQPSKHKPKKPSRRPPSPESHPSLISPKNNFHQIFQSQATSDHPAQTLQTLLQKLDEVEKKLLQKPSHTHYVQYKETLSALFKYAIPQAYHVHTHTNPLNPKTLQHKQYLLLQEVDQQLILLLKNIRNKQVNNPKLIQQLHSLKGLILNVIQ